MASKTVNYTVDGSVCQSNIFSACLSRLRQLHFISYSFDLFNFVLSPCLQEERPLVLQNLLLSNLLLYSYPAWQEERPLKFHNTYTRTPRDERRNLPQATAVTSMIQRPCLRPGKCEHAQRRIAAPPDGTAPASPLGLRIEQQTDDDGGGGGHE